MGTAASVKEVSGKAEALGVIPHSIKFIFAAMQQSRSDYDITMKVEYCLPHLHAFARVSIQATACLPCHTVTSTVFQESIVAVAGRLTLWRCIKIRSGIC